MQTKNIVAFATGVALVVGAILTYKARKNKKEITLIREEASTLKPNPFAPKSDAIPTEGNGSLLRNRYPRNAGNTAESPELQEGPGVDVAESD